MTYLENIINILGDYPKNPQRQNIQGKRYYVLPGYSEKPLISVTTVVKDVIDKPALVNWAKNIGINSSQETLKSYLGQTVTLDLIKDFQIKSKNAVEKTSTSAADFGTYAHHLIESIIKGENPQIPKEYTETINSFFKWRNQFNIDILFSEICVYSKKYSVAGTLDAIGIKDNKIILVDWKTSKALYPEYALQAGGYICCLEDMTNNEINEGWIVRLGKSSPEFEVKAINIENSKKGFIQAIEFWKTFYSKKLYN
ncbi:MAG: hypothetical protein CL758_08480 [Chloroflexi bacterium]|nr:hypothetical protein [Chloroflexota bacterium]|tara:strand:+ start:4040 stop:4804 length:765 start_codon:yes stop_codon:yes gene_type:complete